jgi:hypothetical protein
MLRRDYGLIGLRMSAEWNVWEISEGGSNTVFGELCIVSSFVVCAAYLND